MSGNHTISLQEGAKLTKKYRDTLLSTLSGVKGLSYDNASIQSVLDQPGCARIRMYFGLSDDVVPKPQLVIVGVDSAGNDMTSGIILDRGSTCPPSCGGDNVLNS